MAEVKLQIHFREPTGDKFKKIISYVNPNCDNVSLRNFATALSNLTTNEVVEVFKIVEKFLSESAEGYISVGDLQNILDGSYTPVADSDSISASDFEMILAGNYSPVADSDSLSASDFYFD